MRSQKTDEELRRMIQSRQGVAGYKQSVAAIREELRLREEERAS